MPDLQHPKTRVTNTVTDAKTLASNIVVDAKALVTDNIALAKAELVPTAKNAGVGAGMFGAAGYLGANGASLLFLAGGLALGLLLAHLAHWGVLAAAALGFVIMAIILFIIAGILALIGKSKIKQVGPPKQTIAEVKSSVDTVKRSINSGKNQVDAEVRDRKALAQTKKDAKDLAETQVVATPARAAGDVSTTAGTGTGAHQAPKPANL